MVDTNVVMSGMFFGGQPGQVLERWVAGRFTVVLSPFILTEYRRVADELGERYALSAHYGVIDAMATSCLLVEDSGIAAGMCRDPDDDKFIACAAIAHATLVTGDRDLLSIDGAMSVRVRTPRAFLESFD